MMVISVILVVFILYSVIGTLAYTSYQIKKVNQSSQISEVMSLKELSKEAKINESVALTSRIEDGLALRGNLIDQAEETLFLAQYKISNDESGLFIVKKIEEAAQRGVEVKILINGLSNLKRKTSYLSLLDGYDNVEIKSVGGINLLKPWEMNNVLHDKLILVDDTYVLSSGRNISNRFMLPKESTKITEDMDVVIKKEGQIAQKSLIKETQLYYEKLWTADYSKQKKKYRRSKWLAKNQERLHKLNEQTLEENDSIFQKNPLTNLTFHPIKNGHLVFNETNKMIKQPIVWKQITTLINEAENHVDLMSPYVVLGNEMFSYLKHPKEKKFHIYTNSGGSSPNVLAFGGYLHQKERLLNKATIWEFQSEDSIHQKVIGIDQIIMGVGSFNVDTRSTFLSSENMFFINSPSGVKELDTIISGYQEERLEAAGLFDYKEDKQGIEKPISLLRKLLLRSISVISPLFRNML